MKAVITIIFPHPKRYALTAALCSFLLVKVVFGVTYTTQVSGPWNAASTWVGNQSPPSSLPFGDVVNVNHYVDGISNNINISGTVNIAPGLVFELRNPHTFTINANGVVNVSGTSFIEVNGTLTINGVLNLNGDGTLSGTGRVTGNFVNNGIVAPGKFGDPIQTLDFTSYNNGGSVLDIQLISPSNLDVVVVSGSALLSGTLNVSFIGSTIVAGQTFQILTASSGVSGVFETVNLPTYPGIVFTVIYNSNSVVIATQSSSPLPVELASFNALPIEKTINLYWQTASERNNLGFEVERSSDARNWEPLGFVAGAGTTTEAQRYDYLDEKPLLGTSYYRLRQLDVDGKEEFSRTVSVVLGTREPSIQLYPNPAMSSLNIECSEAAQLQVFDGMGRLVAATQLTEPGVLPLDVSNYGAGAYFIKVKTEKQFQTMRFQKQ
jgi:Secretion system C-terminal sorting domain